MWALIAAAWAGIPVLLPADESPSTWRAALELADLTPASTPSSAVVRIHITGTFWEILAVAPDGRTRRETVAWPMTEVEREEVALLAKSLVRVLDAVEVPRRNPPPPPPPPPPERRPAPKSEPRAPVPSPIPVPAPAPQAAPEPEVAPPPVSEQPPEPAPPPVPEPAPARPRPAPETTFRPEPYTLPMLPQRQRHALAFPTFFVGLTSSFRLRTFPSLGPTMGIVAVESGRFTVELEGQFTVSSKLSFGTPASNVMQGYARVNGRLLVLEPLSAQLGIGAGLYDFRQFGSGARFAATPIVSAGVIVDLWSSRHLTIASRVSGTLDVIPLRLLDPADKSQVFSPVAGQLSVVVKTHHWGDPNRTVPTSSR